MSLSELPTGHELKGILEMRRQRKTDLQNAPLVVVLADAFVQAGADGVRELMSRIAGSGFAIKPDSFESLFKQISSEYQDPLRENYVAIAFGLSVMSLHEMLANEFFDARDWIARHNIAITGTQFPTLVVVNRSPIEDISKEQLIILRQRASQDKTLSFFFDEPHLMPEILRRHLERFGVLSLIQSKILPLYRKRAQYLLNSPKS